MSSHRTLWQSFLRRLKRTFPWLYRRIQHIRMTGRLGPWNIRTNTFRMIVILAGTALVMVFMYFMAVRILNQDWSKKQQRARSTSTNFHRKNGKANDSVAIPGRPWTPGKKAVARFYGKLSNGPRDINWWLVQFRADALAGRPEGIRVGARLGMAGGGKEELAEVQHLLGIFYLEQKDYTRAVVCFRRSLACDPIQQKSSYNLALAYLRSRHSGEAIRILSSYAGRHPDDLAAVRLLTSTLQQNGQTRLAYRLLTGYAPRSTPEAPLALDAAVLAIKLGRQEESIGFMDMAADTCGIVQVAKIWQSPVFRNARQSDAGVSLSTRLATRAREHLQPPAPLLFSPRIAR